MGDLNLDTVWDDHTHAVKVLLLGPKDDVNLQLVQEALGQQLLPHVPATHMHFNFKVISANSEVSRFHLWLHAGVWHVDDVHSPVWTHTCPKADIHVLRILEDTPLNRKHGPADLLLPEIFARSRAFERENA